MKINDVIDTEYSEINLVRQLHNLSKSAPVYRLFEAYLNYQDTFSGQIEPEISLEELVYPGEKILKKTGIFYSKKDITDFSVFHSQIFSELISTSQKEELHKAVLLTSLFLTTLIRLHNEENDKTKSEKEHLLELKIPYLIDVKNYPVPLPFFGYDLSEVCVNITGNLGCEVGSSIFGNAQLHIYGSVSNCLGRRMRSGKIVVYGNAEYGIGYDMYGGIICIEGNCGYDIGNFSQGGKIYINGDYENLARVRRAEIYHKGERITENT